MIGWSGMLGHAGLSGMDSARGALAVRGEAMAGPRRTRPGSKAS